MDYNQVVKIVTTTTFANGFKYSTSLQKLNSAGNIVEEHISMRNWFKETFLTNKYDEEGKVILSTTQDEYTVFEYFEDGTKTGRRYDKSNATILSVEYYNCLGQKIKEERYLDQYLFSTEVLQYDENGNLIKKSFRYEDIGHPLSKSFKLGDFARVEEFKYDSVGNEISHIVYDEDSNVSFESHSTYNDKNQKTSSTHKSISGGATTQITTYYTYEIKVEYAGEGSIKLPLSYNKPTKAVTLYEMASTAYFWGPEKKRCIPILEEAVADQDKYAEALLGYIYLKGELQTKNPQRGLDLLTKSAEHGDSEGARILAEAYLHQIDGSEYIVPYDFAKASQYFAIAVENGEDSHRALYYAGPAYFYGEGVPQSMEKARKCIEALINDTYVQGEKVFDLLGCMCFEGVGGPVDLKLGEKALRKAIRSDDIETSLEAMNNLGMYFYAMENRLSEAIQLLQSAADLGNAGAQINLGKAYCDGRGVPQDFGKAEHLFQLAAKQGDATAQENLKVLQSANNTTDTPTGHGCSGCLLWTFVIMAVFAGLLHILNFLGVFG